MLLFPLLRAATLAVLISVTVLTATPVTAAPPNPSVREFVSAAGSGLAHRSAITRRQQALAAVNEARAQGRKCGDRWFSAVRPVTLHRALNAAASRWSARMASEDFFAHERGDSTPARRLTAAGYPFEKWGENLAAGHLTASDAVAALLDSPGHCANIMTPFREIGIGYAYDSDSTYRRYWSMDLGTR